MTRTKDLAPTPERVEIMQWTARLGAITAEALADREGATVASAGGRLQALMRAGWLARKRLLTDRPALYTATRAGMRVSALRGLDPCRVSASNAGHLIECARVAAALERCYPDHMVLGERELRRDERELHRTLASVRLGIGSNGEPLMHRPDLVLWPREPAHDREEATVREPVQDGEGLPVPVEVELTIKSPERLTAICLAWARCRTIAGVLYLAPPEVQRALHRAIERAQAQEQIVVLGLDVLGPSGAEDAHEPSVEAGGKREHAAETGEAIGEQASGAGSAREDRELASRT